MEEKKILKFYDDLVKLLHQNTEIVQDLFTDIVNAFLCGHELKDSSVCTAEFYETLLVLSISYLNNIEKKNVKNLLMHPFDEIDEEYYDNLTKENFLSNIISYRRLLFTIKFAIDLKSESDNFIRLMVKSIRPEYIEMFKEFCKLQDIIRNGWIKRSVNSKYNESDAMHSLQMLALASICFCLYPLDHLNKQKVFEMIIIHEIAETVVGDIVENSEEHLNKSERERIAINKIFANLKNKEYFINLWCEFESRETEEAKFAYELDKLDPVLKARYLDKELGRDDLFDDFYDYEDKRGTFINTPLHRLFYSNMS